MAEQNKRKYINNNDEEEYLILKIFKIIYSITFILFPLIGYIHQFIKINRLKNSDGFSKVVSLILISSFIIRVFYWIGERFDITILIQSLCGIFMQIILLYICLKYDSKRQFKYDNPFLSINYFWNWGRFKYYLNCIILYTLTLLSICLIYDFNNKDLMNIFGILTAAIEALLDVPQIIKLCQTKNVQTISYFLVMNWIIGDIFKLGFYILSNSPIQLKLCSIFQIFTDCILIIQIFVYEKNYQIKIKKTIKPNKVEDKNLNEKNNNDNTLNIKDDQSQMVAIVKTFNSSNQNNMSNVISEKYNF